MKINLDKFSGAGTEDVEDWLFNFEGIADEWGWTEDNTKLAYLKHFLSGVARHAILVAKGINTYKEAADYLLSLFGHPNRSTLIADKLTDLSRGNGRMRRLEELPSYLTRFQRIVRIQEHVYGSSLSEQYLLDMFLQGLSPEISYELRKSRCEGLDHAFTLSREIASICCREKGTRRN